MKLFIPSTPSYAIGLWLLKCCGSMYFVASAGSRSPIPCETVRALSISVGLLAEARAPREQKDRAAVARIIFRALIMSNEPF